VNLLSKLFEILENEKIPYCILHSYQDLPEKVSSDVDICVETFDEKKLDEIVWKVSRLEGCKVVSKLYYDIPKGFYYVLSLESSQFLQLDFLNDPIGVNRYHFKSTELLLIRRVQRGINISAQEIEAIYILVKKVIKKQFFKNHQERLEGLYGESNQSINELIKKYFGPGKIQLLKQLLHVNDGKEKEFLLTELRKAFFTKQILLKPWKWPLIIFYQTIRIIRRIKEPTGILVCVLSPDGGGKSSVSKAILERLSGAFRKTDYIHWRPGFLPQIRTLFSKSEAGNEFPITNPHGSKQRERTSSLLRWFYYTLDYIIGYYLKILPMKIRTTAVVMDRYYYDVIVDPKRYGFNLPKWLLKLPLRIIPKPDLTIYLDNGPEEFFKRKQELPVEELKRQVEVWREFISELPNAKIVTTDKPFDDVVNEVTRLVLEQRTEMTKKMLKIDPEETYYLWKSDLSGGFVALPSKKNCRWIIPANPLLTKKSWDLYLPYSFSGKLYKSFFKLLSDKGFLKLLKSKKLTLEFADENQEFKNCIKKVFKRNDFVLAISTGSPGPFRKITGMIMASDGKILGYAKIGKTSLAIERIKNEASVLKELRVRSRESEAKVMIPDNLYSGEIGKAYVLIQSPAPFEGRSGSSVFNENYTAVLSTLIKNTMVQKTFVESEFYRKLKAGIENYPLSFRELLEIALNHLEKIIGDRESIFALSHGDFAPWNMLWNKKEVLLYDWESACNEAPAGIDLMHFLFQTGFLLKGFKGGRLLDFCIKDKPYQTLAAKIGEAIIEPKPLFLAYLLKMAIDEDKDQLLSRSAVERRNLMRKLIGEETE